MTRDEAIQIIERTYPCDSDSLTTGIIGRRLLMQAKDDVEDWRNQPDAVLVRYAQLCKIELRRAEADARRGREYYGYGGTFASHSEERAK